MIQAEIERRVRAITGDKAEALFTGPDVLDWANDGQNDIARRTKCLQRHSQTDGIEGVYSYNLPTNYAGIRKVSFDNMPLHPITPEEMDILYPTRDDTIATGAPCLYYVWLTQLFVYPAPTADGSGNLDIYYARLPNALTDDNSESELPLVLHEFIWRYALIRAKELAEDYSAAQFYQKDYDARISEIVFDMQYSHLDSYPAVREV